MRLHNRSVLIAGAAAFLAVVAYLAIGVFGVHTLFIDDVVDEANPFDVPTESDVPTETSDSVASTIESAAEDPPDPDQATTSTTTPEPVAEVITVTTGSFVDGDHPTSGTGFTITDGSATFLRFEEFETDNGPDLNVYLRSSADPSDYIDLGDLEGNIGDQNYELPADIDLDRYDLVDIWCVRFGVSFGSALLTPA